MQVRLSGDVLVLNRHFPPIRVTTVRRALVQLYEGVATVVDREWRTFDFARWSALGESLRGQDESIATVDRRYPVARCFERPCGSTRTGGRSWLSPPWRTGTPGLSPKRRTRSR